MTGITATAEEFKMTELGPLPREWDVVRLGDKRHFQILPSGVNHFVGKKEYLSTSSIIGWEINALECLVDYADRPSRANMQPVLHSVWFAKMVGTVKVYSFTNRNKQEIDEYILSTGFCGIRCKNDTDPNYIKYILLSDFFNAIKDSLCSGTTQRAINNESVSAIQVPLPPLPEQKKIAYVLSTVQTAIEKVEAVIQASRELKKSLMKHLFTYGPVSIDEAENVPLKETEIGLAPEEWQVVRLDDSIKEAQYGLSLKGVAQASYPILRMNNLVDGQITMSNLQYVDLDEVTLNRFKLKTGDILFNRTNSHELVGKTALFDSDLSFVFASYLIRVVPKTSQLLPQYLNHYLNWGETQARLRTMASRGVSQSNISATKLRSLMILCPSIPVQQSITENLCVVHKKIQVEENKKQALEALFKTLLTRFMTGKIRVSSLEVPV